MKPSARSEALRGFTLIEILVAMAILSIIALLSWRGLDQVIRGREAVMRSLEQERANVELFEQLRRDMQNIAGLDETGQPEVQIGPNEVRLVRHLTLPGIAPRLQVVDYRLEGAHVMRYASAPLTMAADLQTTLQRVGGDGQFSAGAIGGPMSGFAVRAWIPGIGWTSQMSDITAATTRAHALMFGQVPPGRVITGIEVRATAVGATHPYLRVLSLGQ